MIRNQRRRVIATAASLGAWLALPRPLRAAAQLPRTPPQTEGPFYPNELPLEQDNDLVALGGGRAVTAKGVVTNVVGRVLDESGAPLAGARVEIWQCDANGEYHHVGARGHLDEGFQGFGHFVTGNDGGYRFRTIRPAPYSGRTPHIHFKISHARSPGLTTQLYVAGEPLNERDWIYRSLGEQRAAVTREFLKDTLGGAELMTSFDIVLARKA